MPTKNKSIFHSHIDQQPTYYLSEPPEHVNYLGSLCILLSSEPSKTIYALEHISGIREVYPVIASSNLQNSEVLAALRNNKEVVVFGKSDILPAHIVMSLVHLCLPKIEKVPETFWGGDIFDVSILTLERYPVCDQLNYQDLFGVEIYTSTTDYLTKDTSKTPQPGDTANSDYLEKIYA